MSRLLLCLALAIVALAAPPIVPVGKETYPCVDGVNNVLLIGDVGDASSKVSMENVVAHMYNNKGEPSCYKGGAMVPLPGVVKLVKGKVTVKEPVDVRKSGEAKWTFTKNHKFVGTLCKNGKVMNKLIPEIFCHQTVYPRIGDQFADMLKIPATYDLEVILKTLGHSPEFNLPSIPSAINMIVKGYWQTAMTLESESKTVAHIKAPYDSNFVYIE